MKSALVQLRSGQTRCMPECLSEEVQRFQPIVRARVLEEGALLARRLLAAVVIRRRRYPARKQRRAPVVKVDSDSGASCCDAGGSHRSWCCPLRSVATAGTTFVAGESRDTVWKARLHQCRLLLRGRHARGHVRGADCEQLRLNPAAGVCATSCVANVALLAVCELSCRSCNQQRDRVGRCKGGHEQIPFGVCRNWKV